MIFFTRIRSHHKAFLLNVVTLNERMLVSQAS